QRKNMTECENSRRSYSSTLMLRRRGTKPDRPGTFLTVSRQLALSPTVLPSAPDRSWRFPILGAALSNGASSLLPIAELPGCRIFSRDLPVSSLRARPRFAQLADYWF